ncbi:MAG: hypothetical protein AAFV53_05330 [Myxococcota bacterium]
MTRWVLTGLLALAGCDGVERGGDCSDGSRCGDGLECVTWYDIGGDPVQTCGTSCDVESEDPDAPCPDDEYCADMIDGPYNICWEK